MKKSKNSISSWLGQHSDTKIEKMSKETLLLQK